ncbi:DedA family protein [Rothia sp. AR01]|uniref:DedA family protein n=1 Tax=Rothia santali TaxID=2949643 RepID=A0A9X2KI22_9MICC|nr:DedA family protein [Rothia santali]MCP3425394.1 DedA family protein [Rothia santali]
MTSLALAAASGPARLTAGGSAQAPAHEPQELTGIAGWVVQVMEALGAVGAGLLIALENLFPPLPSEAILPLAGFTASRGELSLAAALIFTTLGSVVGALALYGVGRAVGLERIRGIARRMPLVDVADVDKTMAWFHRHGYKAIFFGRMIPIFRSLISIPAGVEKMPLLPFTALTALGSAIWNTIFVLAGFYLGENWHVVEGYVGIFQKIVIAVVVVLVAWWLVGRIRSRRARSLGGDASEDRDAPA